MAWARTLAVPAFSMSPSASATTSVVRIGDASCSAPVAGQSAGRSARGYRDEIRTIALIPLHRRDRLCMCLIHACYYPSQCPARSSEPRSEHGLVASYAFCCVLPDKPVPCADCWLPIVYSSSCLVGLIVDLEARIQVKSASASDEAHGWRINHLRAFYLHTYACTRV